MSILESMIPSLGFHDTVFVKESTTLQKQLEALKKLKEEYPSNKDIENELTILKKGIEGENEIKYQLDKSNLGLYVIHDYNIEYEGMTAQIDYVVISKAFCYFIECKNLIGNIKVDEKGDFTREFYINGKKITKGMYSPLRQVEAQRDVFKKIWNNALSENKLINSLRRAMCEKNFAYWHRVLVVAANNETILNTKKAPKDIKDKIVKADALIKYLQKELQSLDVDLWNSKKGLETFANNLLKYNVEKNINYYEQYKTRFIKNSEPIHEEISKEKEVKQETKSDNNLREKLIEFRKSRAALMKIPPYYIFNNDELDAILEKKPQTIEKLKLILSPIKVKTHGDEIVKIIKDI